MEKSKLNILTNMFENSKDIVMITDDQWNILWERYASEQSVSLPQALKIPENCWETVTKQVYWENYFCDCTVYCSKKNKCRIIIMKPVIQNFDMPEDIVIESAVQSLRQVKNELQKCFSSHQLYDRAELLESIERNCYLLRHKSFIMQMLKSVREKRTFQELFSLNKELKKIRLKMVKEMGIYAQITLKMSDNDLFLNENKQFFQMVLLSGVILCHRNAGHLHQILISLDSDEDKAEIQILLKPDNQEIDMSAQIDTACFGSYSEEEELLNVFCLMHDGDWEVNPVNDGYCCRITFRTDNQRSEITFRQTSKIIAEASDEVYRIMLSRIYLSYF